VAIVRGQSTDVRAHPQEGTAAPIWRSSLKPLEEKPMPRLVASSLALLTLGAMLAGCDKPPETPPPQRSEVVQKTAPGSDPATQSPGRTVEQTHQELMAPRAPDAANPSQATPKGTERVQ